MKYLVTGGCGFIGSNLVDALIARGDEVVVVDNLYSGKKENLNPQAKLVEADICDLEKIKPHFFDIDGVFHLAAIPQVQLSIDEPIFCHNVNVNGTLNVLLAAKEAGVKRVVLSSSCAVYGNNENEFFSETDQSQPISPYGLHKLIGEHYARIFSELYNLETISLRYFNVFGPRQGLNGGYAGVISIFLKQNKNHERLTITGDGSQSRDFVFVSDVVRANIAAMENSQVGHGEVINIGTGESKTINAIADLFGGEKEYLAPRPEIYRATADTSLAKQLLNWQAEVDFSVGLDQVRDWFLNLK